MSASLLLSGPMMSGRHHLRPPIIVPLLIVLTATAAYWRSLFCGIFPWDDAEYLAAASELLDHPTKVFAFVMGNYHPMTMLSLAFDQWAGKGGSLVFHATNIGLHALNAVLVFLICHSLMKHLTSAFLVALLFAVHPIHVEGVAWISERKNVLHVFFLLACCLRYIRYLRQPSAWTAAQIIILFLASLLSKAQAVTLPLVLFSIAILEEGWVNWRRRSVQLLPLLFLSFAFSALAIMAQQDGGYLHWDRGDAPPHGSLLAPVAFMTIMRRLVAPFDLSVIHPLPSQDPLLLIAGILFLVATIIAFVVGVRQRRKVLPALIMIYVAATLPIIQLVPVGSMLTADRYAYLASIPVMAGCVLGIGSLIGTRRAAIALCLVALPLLFGMTFIRVGKWCTPAELFEEAVLRYPESEIAHANLAGQLIRQGRSDAADPHLDKALEIDGTMVEALVTAAQLDLQQGRPAAALEKGNRAVALAPEHPSIHLAYLVRAKAHKAMGEPAEALRELAIAAQHEPGYAPIRYEQGICLAMQGEHGKALDSYDQALALGSKDPSLWQNIAISHGWTGNYSAALDALDVLLRMEPRSAEAHFLKGIALGRLGRDGCEELARAQALGHPQAMKALAELCP